MAADPGMGASGLMCRVCGNAIPWNNINHQMMIAMCPSCSAVFGIAPPDSGQPAPQPKPAAVGVSPRPPASGLSWVHCPREQPPGVNETTGPEGLVLRWRLFHGADFLKLIAPIILLTLAGLAFLPPFMESLLVVVWAVQGVLVLIGFLLLYRVLTQIVNTARIRVDNETLECTQSPLPWKGSTRVPVSEIQQVFPKFVQHVSTSGTGQSVPIDPRGFALYAALRDGSYPEIVRFLKKDQALYLEQEIERYLGIEDRPTSTVLGVFSTFGRKYLGPS